MGKLKLDEGRIRQKLETRERLLVAANRLLLRGIDITLEQVATEANISTATAYRYFTGTSNLKREASLQLKSQSSDNLFEHIPEENVQARLDRLIDYHFRLFIENEVEFRLFLSSIIAESIENKPGYSRAGRRIVLIEEAIKSLKKTLPPAEFNHIVYSLSVFLGIESVTILKDLCKLSDASLLETWKWSVNRIVFRN